MRAHLTGRIVTSLAAPPAGQWDYWDDSAGAVPGFSLRVSAMGRRIYTLVYRLKNSPRARRLSLGDAAHLSLSDARQLAREKLREIDLGRDPAAKRTAPDVRALAESYIESRGPDFRPRTLAGYQQMAKRLPPSIAHTKAADLRRADLRVHLEKMARRAPVMANRYAQFLKAIFRWGMDEELIPANPIERLKRPRKEQKRERVLSDPEIALLWKATKPAKPAVAALVKILLLLGQRLGETLAMRWKDIDMAADPPVWTIPGEVRKNGRTHVVPLSPIVLRILDELRLVTGDKERVFHKVSYSTREFWFGPVRERALAAGAEYFKPHDLRRTCATGVSRLSNPIVASKILGHTATPGVPSVTAIYDRYDRLPEKAAALTAWGAFVETLVRRAP
jgi:integrase